MSADRAEYIRGLRVLADVLERNDDLPLPYYGTTTEITINDYLNSPDPVAGMVAAMNAIPCGFISRIRNAPRAPDAYLYVYGKLHGLRLDLVAFRDATCVQGEDGEWHPVDAITARAPEAGETA